MGYRSDVTIIAYPSIGNADKFALLKLYVNENLPNKFEVIGEGDKRYLYCFIGGVKWYPGYEEVDVYSRLFAEWDKLFIDGEDPHGESVFNYEFMRVGEEYEDVEYHSNYGADHALNLCREVYIDL